MHDTRTRIMATLAIVFAITMGIWGREGYTALTRADTISATMATTRLGLFQPANNGDYQLDGRKPSYAVEYDGWGQVFNPKQAAQPAGDLVFLELQTSASPLQHLSEISDGTWDGYIRTEAEQLKAWKHPILVTFDHEMNGNWYPWGAGHYTPAEWKAAWDHVTSLVSSIAPNVIWVWAPNVQTAGIDSFAAWWPGSAHVGFVGLDGYYWSNGSTWANTFAPSYLALRKLTHKPFIVSETGVLNEPGAAAQIRNLAAGARTYGAIGLVYFDKGQWALTPYRASVLLSSLFS